MATKTFQGRMVMKHDTEANWKKATNFIPLAGEIIVYDDLRRIKIGNGSTKVNDLAFIRPYGNKDPIATTLVNGMYAGIYPGTGCVIAADLDNDRGLAFQCESDGRVLNLLAYKDTPETGTFYDTVDNALYYRIGHIDDPQDEYEVANKKYVDAMINKNASSTEIKTWKETT